MRLRSRRGFSSASSSVNSGRLLALAMKRPWTWQARMRSISITGVFDASDSSKPCFDRLDDRRQVRPRIEQPDLRLHREGVDALLHDRGAFAVVLADDDQRAAGDAAGGEVGQRIGGDVGADRGLEGDRAAQRIVHRGRERRRGGRLAGASSRSGRRALPGCRWRRPARPSGARSARPGSRRHRTRRTAAAPW